MVSTSLKLSSITDLSGKSQVIIKLTINSHCRPCIKTHIFIDPKFFKPVRKNRNGRGFVWDIVLPRRGKFNLSTVEEIKHKRDMVDDLRKRLEIIAEALMTDKNSIVTKESVSEALKLTHEDAIISLAYDQLISLIARRKKENTHCKRNIEELFRLFLKEYNVSEARKRTYRVLFRAMLRYQGYVRKTKKRKFRLHAGYRYT